MTALTRCVALLGLLLSLDACENAPASDGAPSSAEASPVALGPQVPAPILAGVAEPASEDDAPMIYAGRNDVGTETGASPRADLDPRDPALVPDGTPDENATAFFAMRKSKRDGIPVGGIGPHGIHVDSLVVGRGFSNSRCESEAREFSVESDDRVNLCLRVVHAGHIEESLAVKWTRDGRGPKITELSLHNGHAYRTRAWLPIRDYSKGDWHVTVTASDGSVLGEADFSVR